MDGFGYIYKTTNLINGRIYIGQRAGTFKQNYFGSGLEITRAVLKYGKENFKVEIIGYASDRNALNLLEIKKIKEYREVCGTAFLYNIADGGQGGDIGCSLSGESHPNWGKKFSEETKEKLRKAWEHRVVSEETKKKISVSMSGENNTFFGRHHSKASIEKMSQSRTGKPRKTHKAGCRCACCFHEKGKPKSDAAKAHMKLAALAREARKRERALMNNGAEAKSATVLCLS